MGWGHIDDSEHCPYCNGAASVLCPSCQGEGVHGRTITCRYCSGRKRLACPLCVEEDPYAWSYGAEKKDIDGERTEKKPGNVR